MVNANYSSHIVLCTTGSQYGIFLAVVVKQYDYSNLTFPVSEFVCLSLGKPVVARKSDRVSGTAVLNLICPEHVLQGPYVLC